MAMGRCPPFGKGGAAREERQTRDARAGGRRGRRKAPLAVRGGAFRVEYGADQASLFSWMLRVTLGSTGMPGPIVVVTKTFFRYLPLDADGLDRSTSSSTAA